MTTTHCSKCHSDYTGDTCPICERFKRLRDKVRASGRLRRDPNAIKSPVVSFAERTQPPEKP